MPYTDTMKWEMDHANPKDRMFNDHNGTFLDTFIPDTFSKDYALGTPKQLLSRKFLDEATSCFNYEELVRSWMENPTLFIP